jgi:hypothetical protein
MAYFDNPEKAARWERELAGLRAEKERRQASSPVMRRNVGISLAPPAIETRAAFGLARIAEAKIWSPPQRLPSQSSAAAQPARPKAPGAITVKFSLQPVPITFKELIAEAGLPASPATDEKPVRRAAPIQSQAFAITPPKSKSQPISFDELIAESGVIREKAKPAAATGMSLKPAPELITFVQLKAEAAEKRAI